jgi:hypothetical protein
MNVEVLHHVVVAPLKQKYIGIDKGYMMIVKQQALGVT